MTGEGESWRDRGRPNGLLFFWVWSGTSCACRGSVSFKVVVTPGGCCLSSLASAGAHTGGFLVRSLILFGYLNMYMAYSRVEAPSVALRAGSWCRGSPDPQLLERCLFSSVFSWPRLLLSGAYSHCLVEKFVSKSLLLLKWGFWFFASISFLLPGLTFLEIPYSSALLVSFQLWIHLYC